MGDEKTSRRPAQIIAFAFAFAFALAVPGSTAAVSA
jgi:hypothetical protein